MINKGKNFEADIRTLKALSVKRKKNSVHEAEYILVRDAIAKIYGVTIRTVQQWLNKRTPWIRDKREDAGKERKKLKPVIKKMLNDAVESGHSKAQAKYIVSNKSGEKISNRKFEQALSITSTSASETAFGDEAKEFFRKLFELDLIPPDKGVKMKYKKENFVINKSDLEDICRILANAYNRYAEAKDKLNVNRASFRKSKLWQLYDEAVTIINQRGVSISDLKEISLFIQRLEIDRNKISPRVITFWKILQRFKHDITLDEVISMAEEYEGYYD